MKKTPGWYDDEVARHAKLIVNEGADLVVVYTSVRLPVTSEGAPAGTRTVPGPSRASPA